MKTLAKIFLLISVCFLGVIIIFPNSNKGNDQNKRITNNYAFCGVRNSVESKIGQKLFKSLCASCHKLDKKLIGPALAEIDSIIFFNWMKKKNTEIEVHNLKDTGINYHQNTFAKILNKKDAEDLYRYFHDK